MDTLLICQESITPERKGRIEIEKRTTRIKERNKLDSYSCTIKIYRTVVIDGRKKRDPEFAENYEKGFQNFKLGVMLRQAREDAGLTHEELAIRISTKKNCHFKN